MNRSRDYLIHLLTEAAEIEHNLLCSYLYAAFSLKDSRQLEGEEARAVKRWFKLVSSVAVEEMGHLALVNHLLGCGPLWFGLHGVAAAMIEISRLVAGHPFNDAGPQPRRGIEGGGSVAQFLGPPSADRPLSFAGHAPCPRHELGNEQP